MQIQYFQCHCIQKYIHIYIKVAKHERVWNSQRCSIKCLFVFICLYLLSSQHVFLRNLESSIFFLSIIKSHKHSYYNLLAYCWILLVYQGLWQLSLISYRIRAIYIPIRTRPLISAQKWEDIFVVLHFTPLKVL